MSGDEARPRKSASREEMGSAVRWRRLKDRRCRRRGHVLSDTTSVRMMSGAYWPLCERCGYAVEVRPDA